MENNDDYRTREPSAPSPRVDNGTNATDSEQGNLDNPRNRGTEIQPSSGDDEIGDDDDDEIITLRMLATTECAKGDDAFFMFCDGQWIRVPRVLS
ncbi:hypothetical protein psal_cds_1011 [Pandoravirus salinus]|uniref:Uncharacterized protein n=1 Tax=Pandoravirus salinus TaxID=1349410 RepID=S4W067_9VIRU|nr:hypothetical protein psal_cds_1011 [Pandoravirus salinus]AGO85186.1 hypothetical protein psal_cds_1011 [Pandoravirus salinus]